MSQPVKLSDELVLDARLTGELLERSIGGQIELWAQLGRALEPLLRGAAVMALRKAGKIQPLSHCLSSIDGPEGRKRVADFLSQQPFPHYSQAPGRAGLLLRVDADGTTSVGRFVGRRFQPAT